jgi:tRNA-guanine transglycosylase
MESSDNSNNNSRKRYREGSVGDAENSSPGFSGLNGCHLPTFSQYIANESDFLSLPPELRSVNFTERVSWRKFAPYAAKNLPLIPEGENPVFTDKSPALCFHIHATSGRARATTVHFPSDRKVKTPIFMPVGTKGTIKSLTTEEIMSDEALDCPIILGNTYHLALQPGTDLVREMGGLHDFMHWDRAILTDSGGFQMVSLLKLAEITEEGVTFENPFLKEGEKLKSQRMMLRPEDSIAHQNNIGSDIMMALDDVVSSIADNDERFEIATYRTLRWLDRCFAAHARPKEQNLFAIVQGGLDTKVGGLREKCLAGFRARDDKIPGYAIGGLAGGESKVRVRNLSNIALPHCIQYPHLF